MDTNDKPWDGYTLDQLRVMRIVNLTKIELNEAKLKHMTNKFTSAEKGAFNSSILGKALGALDYFDYGILAYRIGKRVFGLFRRKRK